MVFYFHFRVLSSILSLSFLCSSVSEALFTLSFSYLSERFFLSMIKLLKRIVEINNTGVTGQSLPPKNDFEHARGLRNSAYAVNLTYETYRQHIYIYHAKSRLNTPVWGSLRSPNYCNSSGRAILGNIILNLGIIPSFGQADTVDLEHNISLYCPPSHAIIYINYLAFKNFYIN